MTQEEKEEIISELENYIKEHLHIEVNGYYTPYSGQREHRHKVEIYFS